MNINGSTYYQRQTLLPEIGIEGQQKLKDASVLVVGAGGLGCAVLEQLCGVGIGIIGIVDNDVVQLSNLHRQSLYTESEIGELKVMSAKRRLSSRNPDCTINSYPEMLDPSSALQLMEGYDIVVDCTDNYSTRYLINDACVLTNKPFVYGAIYRFQGQVAVFNYQNGPTYRCYFSDFPSSESATDCVNSGVIGVIPSIVGNFQALEAIKMVLGMEVLSKDMMLIDLKSMLFQKIMLPQRITDYSFLGEKLDHPFYQIDCAVEGELDHTRVKELMNSGHFDEVIDVREYSEIEEGQSIEGIRVLPLSDIREDRIPEDIGNRILLICKSGKRSREAMNLLNVLRTGDHFSLKGEMSVELMELWKNKR